MEASVPDKEPAFWQRASQAAVDRFVIPCVRAALREVALQSLQRETMGNSATINAETNGNDLGVVSPESQQIVVTAEAIARVRDRCHRVGAQWSRALEEAGHFATALVVQRVVTSGSPTLYDRIPTESGTHSESTDPADTNGPSRPVPHPDTPSTKEYVTNYARIRNIIRRHTNSTTDYDFSSIIHQIDQYGREGRTDWLGDWSDVEAAARKLPARMVYENVNTDGNKAPNIVHNILHSPHPWHSRKRPHVALPPRPPSLDDGTAQWTSDDVTAYWSERERRRLDSCVQSLPAALDPKPSIVLGCLHPVGRLQYYFQQRQPQSTTDRRNRPVSESHKRTRRQQKQATKMRLGDHVSRKDEATTARRLRVSKVFPTVNHEDSQQHWLDLDLGDCILECTNPETGKVSMLAFGSLEVMLLDEDEDDEDQDQEQ
jgi:hypothetical protein